MRRSPALSTLERPTASSRRTVNRGQDEIRYTLSYRGPFDANAAGGTVTQAHIHLGARAVNGGISAFLCSNLGNGAGGHAGVPGARAR